MVTREEICSERHVGSYTRTSPVCYTVFRVVPTIDCSTLSVETHRFDNMSNPMTDRPVRQVHPPTYFTEDGDGGNGETFVLGVRGSRRCC